MEKRIAFHSFRRGTGRSSLMTNATALLAKKGKRVGVIDANLQSPSAHILFGLPDEKITKSLNDYLWDQCRIGDIAYDVGDSVAAPRGQVYLIPASDDMVEIMHMLKDGFELARLTEAFESFSSQYNLDYLLIDTGSGLNQTVLACLAVSDTILVVMRLDEQDYQGVATTLSLADRMEVPQVMTVVNGVPPTFDLQDVRVTISRKFDTRVLAVLPHSERFLALGSRRIFVMDYPEHPFTGALENMVSQLI